MGAPTRGNTNQGLPLSHEPTLLTEMDITANTAAPSIYTARKYFKAVLLSMISIGVGAPSGRGGFMVLSMTKTTGNESKKNSLIFSRPLNKKSTITASIPVSQYRTRAFCCSVMIESPNVPGVRRRPQKYQETRRAVPGVRTSRLLCAEHAEHKGTLSFGSSSMRPAIPSHLCLRSGIKADTIVYFLGFIFFKHLTIVSVSRQMVDACG